MFKFKNGGGVDDQPQKWGEWRQVRLKMGGVFLAPSHNLKWLHRSNSELKYSSLNNISEPPNPLIFKYEMKTKTKKPWENWEKIKRMI